MIFIDRTCLHFPQRLDGWGIPMSKEPKQRLSNECMIVDNRLTVHVATSPLNFESCGQDLGSLEFHFLLDHTESKLCKILPTIFSLGIYMRSNVHVATFPLNLSLAIRISDHWNFTFVWIILTANFVISFLWYCLLKSIRDPMYQSWNMEYAQNLHFPPK